MAKNTFSTAEQKRLQEHYSHTKKWLEWGPYLSERQWGTVREDYSPYGSAWDYFPHDHARSRVYRWGEDGIAGISDRHCAICFAVALWNGKDPILKERLFGLTGPEGNHGEDVKELYYYLDNTPSHSYMKHLYKYPQEAFPYADLVDTNAGRDKGQPEYEILDTGVFDNDRYFDVITEYAKADADDMLVKISITNHGDWEAPLTILPTLWLRNLWSFGQMRGEHSIRKAQIHENYASVAVTHPKLGVHFLHFETPDQWLFTNNETNNERVFGIQNSSAYVKDLFHHAVLNSDFELTSAVEEGTKFSPMYQLTVAPGQTVEIRLRLCKDIHSENPLQKEFDAIFRDRIKEADAFYKPLLTQDCEDTANVQRQAYASMLWTKQYFNYDVLQWLKGDPGQPKPPESRKNGRNNNWKNLNNEDIISMPDKWEYPWYAVWDLAFHCIPLAQLDPTFAKEQLILFLREWYMAPNGQIPAYEWAFGDVNPPVHAWAALQVFKIDREKTGKGDVAFLKRIFNKLAINFTWWVNRKDDNENNIFEGGFLGLDNIGIFDRSSEIPGGGVLDQVDGTAWMALYSLNMLEMAIEIALIDNTFEDMCTKFFEHFVHIADALNKISVDQSQMWDEDEGFFFDTLRFPNGDNIPIKIRSLVGLMTANVAFVITREMLEKLPGFYAKLKWFRRYRRKQEQLLIIEEFYSDHDILLSLVPKARLQRLLSALLDPNEFLSDYGIRALSKIHKEPYQMEIAGQHYQIKYTPAESDTYLFGGNSNWRGPIWFPMNFLFIKSLQIFDAYYGKDFTVEFPTGSGNYLCLEDISHEISRRLISIFQKDGDGNRPVHQLHGDWYHKPAFENLPLFFEYFDGDTGRGVGASHQTGWTGLVAYLIDCSFCEKHT